MGPGALASSCNPATWRQVQLDGLRRGHLVVTSSCRPCCCHLCCCRPCCCNCCPCCSRCCHLCCCCPSCCCPRCPSCCCPRCPSCCCYCPCCPACWLQCPPSGPPCSPGVRPETHVYPLHSPCHQPRPSCRCCSHPPRCCHSSCCWSCCCLSSIGSNEQLRQDNISLICKEKQLTFERV